MLSVLSQGSLAGWLMSVALGVQHVCVEGRTGYPTQVPLMQRDLDMLVRGRRARTGVLLAHHPRDVLAVGEGVMFVS